MIPLKVKDLRGHKNGRLTVLDYAGQNHESRALWRCVCECGNEIVVQSNSLLRYAGTRSCGCLRTEASARRRKPEGAWNKGKSYAIGGGVRCYRNRAAWSKAAIRHYGNRCESCGWSEARCDVHHRVPKARGGLHTIANAVVLCPNCHRIEHERGNHD